MPTELRSLWASRHDHAHQDTLDEIARMLEEGWELVNWQAVVAPSWGTVRRSGNGRIAEYDAFLLIRVGPDMRLEARGGGNSETPYSLAAN